MRDGALVVVDENVLGRRIKVVARLLRRLGKRRV